MRPELIRQLMEEIADLTAENARLREAFTWTAERLESHCEFWDTTATTETQKTTTKTIRDVVRLMLLRLEAEPKGDGRG